jgi:ribonuclease HI
MNLQHVKIFTDGACIGNPGPGGYGVVIIYSGHRKELSGGYHLTTNNRMELIAAIKGLKSLKRACKVKLFSDSKYLVEAMNKGWLDLWRKKNWRKSNGGGVLNIDLWKQLFALCQKHEVAFVWIKGHAGNKENERCDKLAMDAAKRNNLPRDTIFEKENPT